MSAPALQYEPLWTARDLARYVGKSIRWVRAQTAAPPGPDRIPVIRVGGAVRFEPEKVRAWVSRGVAIVRQRKKGE